MAAGSCCESCVNSLYYGLWPKECSLVIVTIIGKTARYLYERGFIRGELLKPQAAVVELEPWRARASMKSRQTPTPNIGLFGFCWILKIRRLPVLGLEFEAESQKCLLACNMVCCCIRNWPSCYSTSLEKRQL